MTLSDFKNGLICNSELDPKFQIWADLVPTFKYNLICIKFGIQSKENMLLLNILFGNDELVPNFGPPIEVLSNFMKFCTKNKWNRYSLPGLWANVILKLKYVILLFTRLEIENAVKSRGTVRKFRI